MTSVEIIKAFAIKNGKVLKEKTKVKVKESDITTAKQKDVVIKIGKDLGYIE